MDVERVVAEVCRSLPQERQRRHVDAATYRHAPPGNLGPWADVQVAAHDDHVAIDLPSNRRGAPQHDESRALGDPAPQDEPGRIRLDEPMRPAQRLLKYPTARSRAKVGNDDADLGVEARSGEQANAGKKEGSHDTSDRKFRRSALPSGVMI